MPYVSKDLEWFGSPVVPKGEPRLLSCLGEPRGCMNAMGWSQSEPSLRAEDREQGLPYAYQNGPVYIFFSACALISVCVS